MSSIIRNTDKSSASQLFGASDLKENVLPLNECVLKYYLFLKTRAKADANGKDPSKTKIFDERVSKLEALWYKSSVPSVPHQQIVAMVNGLYVKLKNLMKTNQKQNDFNAKLEAFKTNLSKLFDISACKCVDFSKCKCNKYRKYL